MEKTIGYFAFGGMLIGAFLGLMWSAGGKLLVGMGIGALIGIFIGWFIAAAVLEQRKKQK